MAKGGLWRTTRRSARCKRKVRRRRKRPNGVRPRQSRRYDVSSSGPRSDPGKGTRTWSPRPSTAFRIGWTRFPGRTTSPTRTTRANPRSTRRYSIWPRPFGRMKYPTIARLLRPCRSAFGPNCSDISPGNGSTAGLRATGTTTPGSALFWADSPQSRSAPRSCRTAIPLDSRSILPYTPPYANPDVRQSRRTSGFSVGAPPMLIRRETLQAVRPATTTDDTRYFLAGIQILPSGACVATDGHVLIKASEPYPLENADFPTVPGMPADTTEPSAPILIASDVAEKLIKATAKRTPIEVLKTIQVMTNGDGSSYAVATDLAVPIVVKLTPDPVRTFPTFERVIPDSDRPTVTIVLGVPVLETLIKSAKAIGATSIRFTLPTEAKCQSKAQGVINTAITATYKSADVEVFAVAMPMVI